MNLEHSLSCSLNTHLTHFLFGKGRLFKMTRHFYFVAHLILFPANRISRLAFYSTFMWARETREWRRAAEGGDGGEGGWGGGLNPRQVFFFIPCWDLYWSSQRDKQQLPFLARRVGLKNSPLSFFTQRQNNKVTRDPYYTKYTFYLLVCLMNVFLHNPALKISRNYKIKKAFC